MVSNSFQFLLHMFLLVSDGGLVTAKINLSYGTWCCLEICNIASKPSVHCCTASCWAFPLSVYFSVFVECVSTSSQSKATHLEFSKIPWNFQECHPVLLITDTRGGGCDHDRSTRESVSWDWWRVNPPPATAVDERMSMALEVEAVEVMIL